MDRKLPTYWNVYGGILSLIDSVYFWIAVLISITGNGLWARPSGSTIGRWAELALSIIPSMLGFALGGMAILLSFSSGRFLEAIRQGGKKDSYFMKSVASFSHFVFVSTLAIILALVDETFEGPLLTAFGTLCFVYSLLLVVATASNLWATANVFNAAIEPEK